MDRAGHARADDDAGAVDPTTPGSEHLPEARDREEAPRARPWRGRILFFVGLMLLALSLRHAVTGVAPLLTRIEQEIGLDTFGATILGMLPTIAFGLAGFVAPGFVRRYGPTRVAVVAMLVGAAGTVVRVLGNSDLAFLAFGFVALFAMGVGNVVGPPLVKQWFGDRQATAMSVLTLLTQAGATIPALLAVPVANSLGWRFSVGSWGGLMVLAALPWIAAAVQERNRAADPAAAATQESPKVGIRTLLTNPTSLGGAIFYSMAALNTYAMLAWMPVMFQDLGATEAQAAGTYSIFTFLTLPMALVTPIITSRLRRPFVIGLLFPVVLAVGYLGIIAAPSAGVLWAFVLGVSGGAFPFAMVMFNLRTRTPEGSAVVTGFSLGVGYAVGTVGPFLGGLLSSATGGWTVPLLVFVASAAVMVVGAWLLTRDRLFEDGATLPNDRTTEGEAS
ncbi:CynX/NimT family MFS transporter [Cellulomonas fimi]|uniref:MFS transporter n=1 Tax=Cellulomonas fimi TaxID=1708 RepID=A0A7Y0LYS2_CELFI|nr:MFS transporter [Cellulomonas fimi]NMR20344.1 MFS transporter [Cellulomonas fimi]